ncbi:hypothetical protein ABT294_25570 [Nonomuraea sp. NPDC000554]|uniref:hypothetical protein n=1 Tax=Nonomuraea sp. NPDC000554 TaxID=3154259 RepID=UPI003325FD31
MGTAIDRLMAHRDVGVREKTLNRLLYETAARALNIENLDLTARQARVKAKGARAKTRRRGQTREDVYWDVGSAQLLPRLLKGRSRQPPWLDLLGR